MVSMKNEAQMVAATAYIVMHELAKKRKTIVGCAALLIYNIEKKTYFIKSNM